MTALGGESVQRAAHFENEPQPLVPQQPRPRVGMTVRRNLALPKKRDEPRRVQFMSRSDSAVAARERDQVLKRRSVPPNRGDRRPRTTSWCVRNSLTSSRTGTGVKLNSVGAAPVTWAFTSAATRSASSLSSPARWRTGLRLSQEYSH